MKLETIVGGTQSGEPHKVYKEGDGRLLGLACVFRLIFCLDIFCKFLRFRRVWRDSCLGISSPPLSDLMEGFFCISPTLGLQAKHFSHIQHYFYSRGCCFVGQCSGRLVPSSLVLFSSMEGVYLALRELYRRFQSSCHILVGGQLIFHPSQRSSLGKLRHFCGSNSCRV